MGRETVSTLYNFITPNDLLKPGKCFWKLSFVGRLLWPCLENIRLSHAFGMHPNRPLLEIIWLCLALQCVCYASEADFSSHYLPILCIMYVPKLHFVVYLSISWVLYCPDLDFAEESLILIVCYVYIAMSLSRIFIASNRFF